MSDTCIRDFLHQLDHLFRRASRTVSGFISRRVAARVQNVALRSASEEKAASVAQSGVTQPAETEGIIDALAQITARLQSQDHQKAHLRSTERGIFVLSLPRHSTQEQQELLHLIHEAGEAGFFRILTRDAHLIRFRVHASLAAQYQFSYRGAYYDCPLSWYHLAALRRAVQDNRVAHAVNILAEHLSRDDPDTLPLFQ